MSAGCWLPPAITSSALNERGVFGVHPPLTIRPWSNRLIYIMKKSLANPTIAQLTRAIGIREKIEGLTAELQALLGGAMPKAGGKRGPKAGSRRRMSAAARAKIAAAARARWKAAKAAGKSRL
jgi:hypothetical protein